jgi:AcrR family transcriptional regulator
MPKIVDRELRRATIARNAIEIFAKKGFQQTTVQDIADASKIGKGTLYHYFHTKMDILEEVSNEMFRNIKELIDASLFQLENPAENLPAIIETALTKEMEYLFIIYVELWINNYRSTKYSDFLEKLKDYIADFRKLLARKIENRKNSGGFKEDIDPNALAYYLVSSMDGLLIHYMLDKSQFNIRYVLSEVFRFLQTSISREA